MIGLRQPPKHSVEFGIPTPPKPQRGFVSGSLLKNSGRSACERGGRSDKARRLRISAVISDGAATTSVRLPRRKMNDRYSSTDSHARNFRAIPTESDAIAPFVTIWKRFQGSISALFLNKARRHRKPIYGPPIQAGHGKVAGRKVPSIRPSPTTFTSGFSSLASRGAGHGAPHHVRG